MSLWTRKFPFHRRQPELSNEKKYAIEHGVDFEASKHFNEDGSTAPGDLTSTKSAHDNHHPEHSFLNLPPEISQLILRYCHTVGILSLRHSSRQLREDIPAPVSTALDKAIFWKLLKKDRFFELCSLEQAGRTILRSDVALCSDCLETHSLAFFSCRQLSKPSRFRQCLGTEGRLRICQHATISFQGAKFAAAGHPGQEACTAFHGSVPPWGPRLQVKWTQDIGGRFGLCSEHYIDHWENLEMPSMSRLKKSFLTQLGDLQVCPHTRGRDIPIDMFFKVVRGSSANRFAGLQNHLFICRNMDCYTTVHVVQRRGTLPTGAEPSVTALVMEIKRNLGRMRVPADKHWLAQIGCSLTPSRQPLDGSNRAHQNTGTRVNLLLFEVV
jgi:hypothetical protein